ncbi:MAG: amino acid permease [Lewinellaceae bacterium]|nr:amino acid permease [Lewinellaceae bacterium]MCB9286619.1 amino acid permease [Lewinellaceae bacterium]
MPQLDRKLTLFGLTMIAVGSCIGSGIFVTPYEIVRAVPHHGFVLIVWALGGVIALTGALTFAELGGMFPQAGGVYVFLREAYGELAGFLYGWVILLVINTGALAALGIALAEYLSYFYPLDYGGKIIIAIIVIAGLTGLNLIGINTSQWFANIFTGLKLLALGGIIIAGLVFFDPAKVQLHFNLLESPPPNLGSALLLALIGVLWSFGGWHHASYLAGEAVEPQRTVPRAMVLGALIVTATYVLANLAYMLLLPLDAIAATTRVAGEAAAQVVSFGGRLVAVAIAISIFGTIGIYTMSAPRIYFAMAKDGVFFEGLAYIHPRFHTPSSAMLLQAGWAILLLLFWGTFSELITYVTFMDIAFMALAGMSVFVFRKTRPGLERPYRAWGYPFIPGIFVLISSAFVVNTLIQRPVQAFAGLAFLLLGIGAYFLFRSLNT